MFDHQAEWAFTDNPLVHLKAQLIAAGMSETDFNACLSNQALLDKVRAMHAAASGLGVKATPTFFVNEVRLDGETGLDNLTEFSLLEAVEPVFRAFFSKPGVDSAAPLWPRGASQLGTLLRNV